MSERNPGWHTEGGGNPHLCHMCRINIWAYIHRLAQRGRRKYRNYAHAYFTGIPQKLLIWQAAAIGPPPDLCLHRRQQKGRLCHVCAQKLGHGKATSFPPLRGRIRSPPTAPTSRKLFGKL